ncbi:MAG: ABC transporter permease [Chitinophagaceae bacterium]|nr:ABC transporter permease [Chitinophagaceae bacterium]
MFKNYFKTAWRNLIKNKISSYINIGGLAVGMMVAMLIGLWVWDELSFNKYHKNYDRIAQVMKYANYDDGPNVNKNLPYPLTIELKEKYTRHFKHVVTARQQEEFDLSAGEKKVAKTGQFIDAGAPEMLSLKMLKGSRAGLEELHSIILSASTAKALFGDADPMGKPMKINNRIDVKVTGVFEDLPLNSQFHSVQFFSPFDLDATANNWIREQSWDNQFLLTYVEINTNTDFESVSASIKDAEISITKNLENYARQAKRKPQLFLNPMSQWHLYSEFKNGLRENGPIRFVKLIGSIGGFVLLLACINFMNLSTARAEKRAKEVGIRKTIGSVRLQLIGQFFSESLLVALLAFILSVFLVVISLPGFNVLATKQLSVPWATPGFWLCSLGFILLTGLLAGSYPALYLSSFSPVKVLKGTFRAGRFAAIPRKILVVIQFTVSTTLIIATIIVYRQISFAKDRPVGYARDGLLMVQKKSDDFYGKFDLFNTELKNTGVVTAIAESGGKITGVWQGNNGFDWKGRDPSFDPHFGTLGVTYEYGQTVGWQFIAGRDFSKEIASDSTSFVISESAAKLMGMENPVGEFLRWETPWRKGRTYKIIGVIKDMVMDSPFEPIVPTIFRVESSLPWINIRINPAVSAGEALPKIEAVFKRLVPSAPFDYKFADTEYAAKFATEERIGKLSGLFAILAIFVSCLGLFGLASFVAEQRIKEIGVRKVLGASVFDLWGLLSKDFVVLVIISLLIAAPIAYYFMYNWLQNYPYRAKMSWWIFGATGLVSLLITLCTVSFQAIKAAIANPVGALRTE